MSQRIFVSYSHEDKNLIGPIVRLLRAARGFVFHDTDNIRLGKKWRAEIARGLGQADLVLVFWCFHSAESVEVEREYRAALEHEKDLLPVLLDRTKLPRELAEYQVLDFYNVVGEHGEKLLPQDRPEEPSPSHGVGEEISDYPYDDGSSSPLDDSSGSGPSGPSSRWPIERSEPLIQAEEAARYLEGEIRKRFGKNYWHPD